MKVKTNAVRFSADQKLVAFIEKKLGKLETIYDRITHADVSLKLENSGKVKDKIVEVKVHIPGNTIVAKETSKTFEEAVDKSVDVLKRQLIKQKEKMRRA